jgi:hypothetical protein
MTWSMLSAAPPQYWHECPSRAKIPRRLSGARRRNGTFTNVRSRTTDGTATVSRSEWRLSPVPWSSSALWSSTSTTARLLGTTHSGS